MINESGSSRTVADATRRTAQLDCNAINESDSHDEEHDYPRISMTDSAHREGLNI
jgi:hypothetical protein